MLFLRHLFQIQDSHQLARRTRAFFKVFGSRHLYPPPPKIILFRPGLEKGNPSGSNTAKKNANPKLKSKLNPAGSKEEEKKRPRENKEQ